jgi:hypothetical protein
LLVAPPVLLLLELPPLLVVPPALVLLLLLLEPPLPVVLSFLVEPPPPPPPPDLAQPKGDMRSPNVRGMSRKRDERSMRISPSDDRDRSALERAARSVWNARLGISSYHKRSPASTAS